MRIKFIGIGWKSKAMLKRATLYISISKLVAIGCSIQKGQALYSYLAEDEKGKKIIVTYLGKENLNCISAENLGFLPPPVG